jgi:hypothetical protein
LLGNSSAGEFAFRGLPHCVAAEFHVACVTNPFFVHRPSEPILDRSTPRLVSCRVDPVLSQIQICARTVFPLAQAKFQSDVRTIVVRARPMRL